MFRWGEIGQWVGMAVTIAGLVIEAITKADYGYIVLTGGSLMWGVFTKVKYYRATKRANDVVNHRLR